MPHQVFISHSSVDKEIAGAICEKLEASGVPCWIAPRNIVPGDDWSVSIMDAMKCPIMVLVFSAEANESPHVQREVGRAFAKDMTVIPFRIEQIAPVGSMEYYLASVHWLDAVAPPLEKHLITLAEKVGMVLERVKHAPEPGQTTVHHTGMPIPPKGMEATVVPPAKTPADPVMSVIKEAQKETAEESELPLRLLLNFSKVLVAGYSSTIGICVENKSQAQLEDVSVSMESNGFASSTAKAFRKIPPGHSVRDLIEIDSARGGNFVLRCQVKYAQAGTIYYLRGTTQLTVNLVPEGHGVSLGDMKIVRGGPGAGAKAGENIAHIVPEAAVQTINDLLNYTLPEAYARVPLEVDYDISQMAVSRIDASVASGWSIPKQFLNSVGQGTKLKLEPRDAGKMTDGTVRGLHLVARTEFTLGRSRTDTDYLTWFWPRNAENDAITRRLSRVHARGVIEDGKIILKDAGSTNVSTFEGLPLDENGEITQRGTLLLGQEYALDVMPFQTTLPGGLQVANERTWKGATAGADVKAIGASGCVRFIPTNTQVAMFDALWLFTDANFGASRQNPIILALPKIGEAEGRFHYYHGNFWIEAFQGASVRVDGVALKPDEIVPIAAGQEVVIGEGVFVATVEG